MTVSKNASDLDDTAESGPKLINTSASDASVIALKKRYKNAREIEKLPSGTFAVRFRRKATVRFTPKKG